MKDNTDYANRIDVWQNMVTTEYKFVDGYYEATCDDDFVKLARVDVGLIRVTGTNYVNIFWILNGNVKRFPDVELVEKVLKPQGVSNLSIGFTYVPTTLEEFAEKYFEYFL
jgi:hypothetical protein